jgi:hydrogenase maturation protease
MSARPGDWEALERRAPEALTIGGVAVRAGSRVRLLPRDGGDVLDIALAGRAAVVESIEQDVEGTLRLAVVVDDDPGRDLGGRRRPGHRLFFAPDEVEPLRSGEGGPQVPSRRVLVAGIGNVFLADDAFGVALAARLARRALPPGVEVVDFGIRGMDLAYALEAYDAVLLLDAVPRGQPPGTLSVIEPDVDDTDVAPEAHGMSPANVLALARALGGTLPRTLVVGCEPQIVMTGEEDEIAAELSAPVRAALDPAVELVESLLRELVTPEPDPVEVSGDE